MSCERYSEWVSLYIDKELEKSKEVMFEDHINSCNSCREELDMLQEIMKDIKGLEMIEPPEFFHDDLMKKLQVTSLSVKKSKWHVNLKMVSAVAAVFIFSVILINPLKTTLPTESLMKIEDRMLGPDTMKESSPGAPVDSQEISLARSLDEPTLEMKSEEWTIKTTKYKDYKEAISKVSHEMGLELIIVEELGTEDLKTQRATMEIMVEQNKKAELEAMIREIDQGMNILTDNQGEEEGYNQVRIVIFINQLEE